MSSRTLATSLVLLSAAALATPTYPFVIQTQLNLSKAVPQQCALCHVNNVQVASAVQTPFALSLKTRGVVANNETSLKTALTQLETDRVDSDGDGVTDIDELKAGTDPNPVVDAGVGAVGPPRYGCGASVVDGLDLLVVALAVVFVGRLVRPRRLSA